MGRPLTLSSFPSHFFLLNDTCNRISSTTKRCEPFAEAQTPHTHRAHKAQGIHSASFKISQLFYKLCRLFAFPPSLTFVHMEHCHCRFQKPSGSCGKVSSSWTSHRFPRRGAGISSAPCEGFANQVISCALHHTGVYIRLCGSLHMNRHLSCI